MDQNSINPPSNPSEIPIQIQPTESPLNKPKNNIPIILGGLIILLGVGSGAYYLGTKQNNKPQTYSNTLPKTTPQPSSEQYTPNISISPTNIPWKTETHLIKTYNQMSGETNFNLTFQIPSAWNIQKVNRQTEENDRCLDIDIKDNNSTLTIHPICDGWSAKYSDWPSNAVTIKEEKNVGNDAHTAYTVRYLDSTTNQYKYVEGEKDTSNKIMDAILIRSNTSKGNFLPSNLTLNYTGSDKDSILKITDQIITSLKAQ